MESTDPERFRKLLNAWMLAAGARSGNSSRLGKCEWSRYEEEYVQESGKKNAPQKVMATKKEFVESMMKEKMKHGRTGST